ncbi:tigger transposable element-derived protein 6-like [Stegodyphus dumicola]|uniref:tigger transposable element-derived protein 6-like n=1 Tax=Stegodyphus dumicola TaxID=202533 RepID=UPI0015B0C758|nr:tigger transposable element-derived protein 6-like [Stegodyphus dumicola]
MSCNKWRTQKLLSESVEEWFKNLSDKTDGYELKDIFNVDETALFLMPARTLAFKGDYCHGSKESKERFTVLLRANADGRGKMTPIFIGNSQKPRCFKNITTLPLKANMKVWMVMDIFTEWLKTKL